MITFVEHKAEVKTVGQLEHGQFFMFHNPDSKTVFFCIHEETESGIVEVSHYCLHNLRRTTLNDAVFVQIVKVEHVVTVAPV